MSDSPDKDVTRYAVDVLRGLKDRVDEIETAVLPEDAIPNILRSVFDRVSVDDLVNARFNDREVFDDATVGDVVNARANDRDVADEAAVGDTVTVATASTEGDLRWDTSGTWDGTDTWG